MYKKTQLTNKLRVVTHEMAGRDSISLGIWIGAGGRFENAKNKGVAHFLEHILFKGTKNYSCEKIKELIEGVGGSLNAFTSEENTCYFAKIPSKHLKRTFDILSDMVLAPLITKDDVNKERGVILEEIKMYHDLPQHYVIELLEEMMWPNHPLGMNLAGTAESVGKLSYEDLRQFHQGHYAPANIVVASAGHVRHKEIADLVQKKFSKALSSGNQDFLKAPHFQDKPKVKFFRKDIEQMHLALGMFALERNHKDKHAFALLNIILGGNMSSRLFDEVREKRGLAYSIGSSGNSLKDTGLFMVRAGVDNKKIIEAVSVILKELEKVKKSSVSQDEFTRAREYYIGQTVLDLEDTLEHMFWVGGSLINLNKVRMLKEVLKEVNKVKIEDITRVANVILKNAGYNLSIVGPLEETQEKELAKLLGP